MRKFGLEVGNGLEGMKSGGQKFWDGVQNVCSSPECGYRSGWVERLYIAERGLWVGGRQNAPWQKYGGWLSPSHGRPD